jgi:hypothetical protein
LVDEAVAELMERVRGAAESVSAELAAKLATSIGEGGSPMVAGMEGDLRAALRNSDLFDALVEFVAGFNSQVHAFNDLRVEMGVPEMELNGEDVETLLSSGELALAALDHVVDRVDHDFRQLVARGLGGASTAELVSGTIEVVARLSRVEPVAKDQLFLWFRTLNNLSYRALEAAGHKLAYRYVGLSGKKKSRSFCEELVAAGRSYSREEVEAMSNDRVAGAFASAGGVACAHWWAAELAA